MEPPNYFPIVPKTSRSSADTSLITASGYFFDGDLGAIVGLFIQSRRKPPPPRLIRRGRGVNRALDSILDPAKVGEKPMKLDATVYRLRRENKTPF